jgi:TfoX/Sxy family transcriptional regulator of competence genes
VGGLAGYVSGKHGLIGLTRTAALDLHGALQPSAARAGRRGGAGRRNRLRRSIGGDVTEAPGRREFTGSAIPPSRTIASVAYDEELADRIRQLVAGESDLTERKMFGGLAFLIGGNMAVAASGQGGVLVRVDPAQSDALLAKTNARLMEMRGRSMRGWLRVDPEHVRTKRQLAKWVELGTTYARSLPAKR